MVDLTRTYTIYFYIFNFIVLINGLVLIALGIKLLTHESNQAPYYEMADYQLDGIGVLLIFTGSVVFILAIIGYWSLKMNSRGGIIVYMTALIITIVLEISGAILCLRFAKHSSLRTDMLLLDRLEQDYNRRGQEVFTDKMNRIQEKFRCCGVHGWMDYTRFQWDNGTFSLLEIVPRTCCAEKVVGCNHRSPYVPNRPEQLFSLYRKGCSKSLKESISRDLFVPGILILIVFILQWPGIIAACRVLYDIEHRQNYVRPCPLY